MAGITWIKIATYMFDDEKIKLIQNMTDGDAILVVWVRLLTLAGKTNDGGHIYLSEGIPYTDEMLACIFNKPLPIVRLALDTFIRMCMVEANPKGLYLVNWDKHQNIDGLERIREQNRIRKQKQREKLNCKNKFELLKELTQAASVNVVTDGHYEGLTVGIYGSNKEIKGLSKETYTTDCYEFLDLKNYPDKVCCKIISNISLLRTLELLQNKMRGEIQLGTWCFDVREKDIIDYCGFYTESSFKCDGVVIRRQSQVKNIRLLELNMYHFTGDLKRDYLLIFNEFMKDVASLNGLYVKLFSELVESGIAITDSKEFIALIGNINVLQMEIQGVAQKLMA